jgi:hypothetical protein
MPAHEPIDGLVQALTAPATGPGEHSATKGGLLDLSVITTEPAAMILQHIEFAFDARQGHLEDVAGVRVLGNHPQGLALAGAAHQDRWVRAADRLRMVQRPVHVEILSHERRVVVLPHLVRQLQHLLQMLEALLERRVGHPEPHVFLLVPGRTDPEIRTAAGQHVQSGGRLDQHSRMAVGDTGDRRPELDLRGDGRGKGQHRPSLEHVLLRCAVHGDLEEVVHHPQAGQAGLLGLHGDASERAAGALRSTRKVERVDL